MGCKKNVLMVKLEEKINKCEKTKVYGKAIDNKIF
jgi:hypothetical protein